MTGELLKPILILCHQHGALLQPLEINPEVVLDGTRDKLVQEGLRELIP